MDDVTRKSTTGFVFLFGHIAVSARETRRFFGSVEFDETKKGWLELKGRKSNKNSATKGMNGVERPDKGVARDIAKMGENRGEPQNMAVISEYEFYGNEEKHIYQRDHSVALCRRYANSRENEGGN
jgi:hypothetical protein